MSQPRDDRENEVMEQLQALGYIDPGAGSSMFQLLLGGFFKISRLFKSFFRKFLFLSASNKSTPDEE